MINKKNKFANIRMGLKTHPNFNLIFLLVLIYLISFFILLSFLSLVKLKINKQKSKILNLKSKIIRFLSLPLGPLLQLWPKASGA